MIVCLLIALGLRLAVIAKQSDQLTFDRDAYLGIAKSIADDMMAAPSKDPEQIARENPDYLPVSDIASIEPLVNQVLSENAPSIADYKAGRTKAFAFLVGQVMKLCRGKASPAIVNELLRKKLD